MPKAPTIKQQLEAAQAAAARLAKQAAARNSRAKANLLAAGGRRLTVNLRPMATDALASIRMNDPEATTDTVAIERAIFKAWHALRRQKARAK